MRTIRDASAALHAPGKRGATFYGAMRLTFPFFPLCSQGGSSELLKNLKTELKQKISELSALTSTSEVRHANQVAPLDKLPRPCRAKPCAVRGEHSRSAAGH